MTTKEKAEELFDKFRVKVHDRDGTSAMNGFEAKQCALIAVDEILESLGYKSLSDSPYTTLEARQYYVQVKQEIKKL
jgi:hypothetical protein